MKYQLTYLSLIVGIIAFLGVTGVYAKNSDAPGQAKKEDVQAVNTIQGNSNAGKKNVEPTEFPVVPTSMVRGNSSANSSSPKKNEITTTFQIDKNGKKVVVAEKKLEKLGVMELRKLIETSSTDSARKSNTKFDMKKLQLKEATSPAVMKRHAVSGVVTAIDGNTLTIVHQIQRDRTWTIVMNEGTLIHQKTTESSGSSILQVGVRIAAVGIPQGSTLIAKSIHVIPGKALGIVKRFPSVPVSSVSATIVPTVTIPASVSATPQNTVTPTEAPEMTPTPVL